MSATVSAPPLAAAIPTGLKKRRVLLVDTCRTKRELRAEVMRKLGIDVDCAGYRGSALLVENRLVRPRPAQRGKERGAS